MADNITTQKTEHNKTVSMFYGTSDIDDKFIQSIPMYALDFAGIDVYATSATHNI